VIGHRLACVLALAGCAGTQDRPEPPSGAVDPGIHGLAVPGATAPPAVGAVSSSPAITTTGAPTHGPATAPTATPHAGGEPVGEATGAIVMTREHCETLGRKFAELTLAQGGMLGDLGGGADPGAKGEAAGVGKTFADGCVHDLVGQTVEAREYQCMLRAQSPDGLLACKK
jgi:hypothetical protein